MKRWESTNLYETEQVGHNKGQTADAAVFDIRFCYSIFTAKEACQGLKTKNKKHTKKFLGAPLKQERNCKGKI